MQRAWLHVMVVALLVAGCSKPVSESTQIPPAAPAVEATPPLATTPAPAQDLTGLFPAPGKTYRYTLSDGPPVEEQYVRDGGRLIGAANGKTYVTWFFTDRGVWRLDPKGNSPLRYLPPELKDNLAWKQTSGADTVWFRLWQREQCHIRDGAYLPCWELTVLNRQERTIFRLVQGEGIVQVRSDNAGALQKSYTKVLVGVTPVSDSTPEQLLREGARLSDASLPVVTEVAPFEFDQAEQAMLTQAGWPITEIDLNGDGRKERLEGWLGQWHGFPLSVTDADGRPADTYMIDDMERSSGLHRLDVINVPGLATPALLYQYGMPNRVHMNYFTLLGEQINFVRGWQPKTEIAWGTGLTVQSDGTIILAGDPTDMGGYQLNRRYRLEKQGEEYRAVLLEERAMPGAYPNDPADLLTAAFMAKWYGLEAELKRYVPDDTQRTAFLAYEAKKPQYNPERAEVGALSMRTDPSWGDLKVPVIQPTPVAPDQPVAFQVKVGQYEGYIYYTGTAIYGTEADGRLVIRQLAITKTGFVY